MSTSDRLTFERSRAVARVLLDLANEERLCGWEVQDTTRHLGVTKARIDLLLDDEALLRVRRAMQGMDP